MQHIPVSVRALLAQLLGLILVLLPLRAGWLGDIHPWQLAFIQGTAAALAAHALGSARWWLPLHLLFVPGVVWAAQSALPAWWYGAALLVLLLVYGAAYRTQVPLYLSNRATIEAVATLLPTRPALRVLDLGAGTGSFTRGLARLRPDCQIVGIEQALLPWWIARLAASSTTNCSHRRGDYRHEHWGGYDVIYAFLSPVPMPDVWKKASREMRSDSLLIANSFAVPQVDASETLAVNDRRATTLYVYRMPGDQCAA